MDSTSSTTGSNSSSTISLSLTAAALSSMIVLLVSYRKKFENVHLSVTYDENGFGGISYDADAHGSSKSKNVIMQKGTDRYSNNKGGNNNNSTINGSQHVDNEDGDESNAKGLNGNRYISEAVGVVSATPNGLHHSKEKPAKTKKTKVNKSRYVDLGVPSPISIPITDADWRAYRYLQWHDVGYHRGFLRDIEPLRSLDVQVDPSFEIWEMLLAEMPNLIACTSLHRAVDRAIPLRVDLLKNERELRRASVILSALSNAYIWTESNKPKQSLPPALATSLIDVNERLGIPPCLQHQHVVLDNWRLIDPNGPTIIGNLATLFNFGGGMDESGFLIVTAHVEAMGAPALRALVKIKLLLEDMQHANDESDQYQQHHLDHINQSKHNQEKVIEKLLREVHKSLLSMQDGLLKMYELVDNYVFYNRVRTFMFGTKGNNLIPNGILLNGVTNPSNYLLPFLVDPLSRVPGDNAVSIGDIDGEDIIGENDEYPMQDIDDTVMNLI